MQPLWWLLDAKQYKEEIHKKNTAETKKKHDQAVTEALGVKY